MSSPVNIKSSPAAAPVAPEKSGQSTRLDRAKAHTRNVILLTRLPGWLFIVFLLLVWQWFATHVPGLNLVLPPVDVIVRRGQQVLADGTLMQRMTETLKVMFSGYLGGCLAGLLLGMLIGRIKIGYLLLEPLLELARPIPIAAIIPILMLFLGLGDGLKIGAVVIASFFPAIINTYSAMRATPQTLEETSLTFGLSRLQATLLVALPHALPVILIGFRLALSISLVVTVFTEMIAGNSGMGYFILNSQQNMAVDDMYTGVCSLAIIGYMLNLLFLWLERRLIFWHASMRRQ